MRSNQGWIGFTAVILMAGGWLALASAEPLGTAISYQGRLEVANFPADGTYDFEFKLYDTVSEGLPVAGSVFVNDATVADGLFTLPLDFGSAAFSGHARWLEIAVRVGDSTGEYEVLSPRQSVCAAPYALYALSGPGSGGYWSANGNDIYNTNIGDVGIGTTAPAGQMALGDYQGGTDGSNISGHAKQLVLGGVYNAGINSGSSVKLLISDYDNDANADIYPIYVEDENNHVDFFVRTQEGGVRTGYFGGKLGIGDTDPSRTLSVKGSGFFSNDLLAAGSIEVVTGTGGSGNIRATLYNGSFLTIPVGGQLATYDENGTMTGIFGSSIGAGGYINLLSEDGGVGLVAEGDSEGAGKLTLKNADLDNTILLDGDEGDDGGDISISDGVNTTIELDGKRGGGGAGVLLSNSNGTLTISIDADSDDAAQLDLRNAAGTQTLLMDADDGGDAGARLRLRDGTMTRFELDADNAGGGAWMAMANSGGLNTVTITADYNDNASQIMLRQGAGVPAVVLYADYEGSGKSRIVADVMEIKAGSDLSERFDVSSPDDNVQPGMVVCIDPSKPGALSISREAYDRKVAGILSGAGGVEPGMIMAQEGSPADGEHPVALTGRVYCRADASQDPIEPGDLLTTSPTPGHAMKVRDYARAQGAVIGKAMTSLPAGQGLVLVLVNLQ